VVAIRGALPDGSSARRAGPAAPSPSKIQALLPLSLPHLSSIIVSARRDRRLCTVVPSAI